MNYTVLWLPDVEQELAGIWADTDDQRSVTEAANEIERLLKRDPAKAGESRPNGRRILLVSPLGIIFRVNELDRVVTVSNIWEYRTRPS
ncbi:MAG: hypothetical protein ACREJB_03220 [Planctomycetaceae bacterium]